MHSTGDSHPSSALTEDEKGEATFGICQPIDDIQKFICSTEADGVYKWDQTDTFYLESCLKPCHKARRSGRYFLEQPQPVTSHTGESRATRETWRGESGTSELLFSGSASAGGALEDFHF